MLLPGVAPEPAAATAQAALELAIVRGAHAEGFAVPAASVAATVTALAGGAPVSGYVLTNLPGEPVSAAARASLAAALPGAQPLTFEALARRALACRFDLCQFEFASQPWRLDRATLRRLRVPIVLVAASLVVAVVGANTQWLMMARQRDAISAQMTELLLNAFPKTTVVLDPAGQMARQLQQLRLAAGEPSPDDFLALSDGLARSLGPVPANGIAAIDYHDRRLDVTFKPGVNVDADLAKRLAGNGLAVTVDASLRGANVSAGTIAVPASLLAGLGAPFNTLDLDGKVRLAWSPWRVFGTDAFGRLTVSLADMSSRVSLVKPLGTYQVVLQAQGATSTLELSTQKGPLMLEGRGSFSRASASFQGTASAAPDQRDNLAGLLNLLGRPVGPGTVALTFMR
ncbi:type II secretion system protein GspL [Paraburkholderia sp. BR14261]